MTGEINIDDTDIYDKKLDVVPLRALVEMVFQKPDPFSKSIYENIAYGPRIHGLASNKADLDEIVISSLKHESLWDKKLHLEGRSMNEATEGRTVKRFDGELTHLHNLVLEIGELVRDQLKRAIQTLEDEARKVANLTIDCYGNRQRPPIARILRDMISMSTLAGDMLKTALESFDSRR